MFQQGQVPGLKSVAKATGTPASRMRRAGGISARPRKWFEPGTRQATVPASFKAARSKSSALSKWSAVQALSLAASWAPPERVSCSAWTRRPRPAAWAARRKSSLSMGPK